MQLPKKRSAEDEIEKVDDFLYNDSTFEVSKKKVEENLWNLLVFFIRLFKLHKFY